MSSDREELELRVKTLEDSLAKARAEVAKRDSELSEEKALAEEVAVLEREIEALESKLHIEESRRSEAIEAASRAHAHAAQLP